MRTIPLRNLFAIAQTVKGWGLPQCWGATAMASRRQRRKSPGSGGTSTPWPSTWEPPLTKGDLRRPPVPAVAVPRPQPTKRLPASRRPYGATDRKGCWTRAQWLRVAPTVWPCALGMSIRTWSLWMRTSATPRTPKPLCTMRSCGSAFSSVALLSKTCCRAGAAVGRQAAVCLDLW